MRMAGRSTPFGLFAGVSVGTIERTACLQFPVVERRRKTRLDIEYLFHVAERLATDKALRQELRYCIATELYQLDHRIRYYQAQRSGAFRRYVLVDLEPDECLLAVIEFTRAKGRAAITEIAEHLVELLPGLELDASTRYVSELVDAGVLVPGLSVTVTGADPTVHLLEALGASSPAKNIRNSLTDVLNDIAQMDADGIDVAPSRYKRVADRLEIPAASPDTSRLFHVELHKPCETLTLSQKIINEIISGVEVLGRIGVTSGSPLFHFYREFETRYQDREVPLLEALDGEAGVRFSDEGGPGHGIAPLLAEMTFARRPSRKVRWTAQKEFLFRRLCDVLGAEGRELMLTEADVASLARREAYRAPPGFSAVVSLAVSSMAAPTKGDDRIYISRLVGPTSGTLLARFCHGNHRLTEYVTAALRLEEECDPDAIHAEIAYLPQGRAGNVVIRPVLREYEISMFNASGAPVDRQIPLNDLLISARDGHFRLRSKTLGKRVVPHLTCAHAFRKDALRIYRFLAGLAEGPSGDCGFSWGVMASAPFLPRVSYRRFVFSLATWNLPQASLAPVLADTGATRFARMQELRKQLRLPRWVRFAESDNSFPIDFDNVLSVESLLRVARGRQTITLIEMFPSPEQLYATGPARFMNELVVPFIRGAALPAQQTSRQRDLPITPDADRGMRPGGEWFFAKLYCGVVEADRIISDLILPFVGKKLEQLVVDRWHFVRFGDPDWHLRFRIRGRPAVIWHEVVPELLSLTEQRRQLISRVEIGTYEPEEDRYGGKDGMRLAEEVFTADSLAAASIVACYRTDEEARWRLALVGMDAMLTDLGLDTERKLQVVTSCRDQQISRYPIAALRRQLARKYRERRAAIEAMLQNPPDQLNRGLEAISVRSKSLRPIMAKLQALEEADRLSHPLITIAQSYLHMWANRLFSGAHNAHELILYEFLARIYRSDLAKNAA